MLSKKSHSIIFESETGHLLVRKKNNGTKSNNQLILLFKRFCGSIDEKQFYIKIKSKLVGLCWDINYVIATFM